MHSHRAGDQMVFPLFKVSKLIEVHEGIGLLGVLNTVTFGHDCWVDKNWLGYLRTGSVLIKGRWSKADDLWMFSCKTDSEIITQGNEFEVFDSYWGQRAEIALNENRYWTHKSYQAKPDWTHDHCDICWTTISELQNREHMQSDDGFQICLDCHMRIVVPRTLDFICESGKAPSEDSEP
jgi:hypothetical protein